MRRDPLRYCVAVRWEPRGFDVTNRAGYVLGTFYSWHPRSLIHAWLFARKLNRR